MAKKRRAAPRKKPETIAEVRRKLEEAEGKLQAEICVSNGLSQDLETVGEEKERFRIQLRQAQDEVESLRDELRVVRGDHRNLPEELASLKQLNEELTKGLKSTGEKLETLEVENSELKRCARQMEDEVAGLKPKLDEATADATNCVAAHFILASSAVKYGIVDLDDDDQPQKPAK